MIEEINVKVKGYRQCIEATEMQEEIKKFKDVTCFSNVDCILKLHQQTSSLWSQAQSMRLIIDSLDHKPFLKLNLSDISKQLTLVSASPSDYSDTNLVKFAIWICN